MRIKVCPDCGTYNPEEAWTCSGRSCAAILSMSDLTDVEEPQSRSMEQSPAVGLAVAGSADPASDSSLGAAVLVEEAIVAAPDEVDAAFEFIAHEDAAEVFESSSDPAAEAIRPLESLQAAESPETPETIATRDGALALPSIVAIEAVVAPEEVVTSEAVVAPAAAVTSESAPASEDTVVCEPRVDLQPMDGSLSIDGLGRADALPLVGAQAAPEPPPSVVEPPATPVLAKGAVPHARPVAVAPPRTSGQVSGSGRVALVLSAFVAAAGIIVLLAGVVGGPGDTMRLAPVLFGLGCLMLAVVFALWGIAEQLGRLRKDLQEGLTGI